MKLTVKAAVGHWLRWLIALVLLIGLTAAPACAEEPSLVPDDLEYENGNIILHKHAERIGPDEWKVVVKATVGEQPVEKRKMEVVFVLDCSGSMAWCTDEEAHEAGSHSHSNSCYTTTTTYTCTLPNHEHTLPDCYGAQCTRQTNSSHWSWFLTYYHNNNNCEEIDGKYYPLTCTQHVHDDGCYTTTRTLTCGKDACTHSENGATACTYTDANGNKQQYKTRLQAAKETIASMVSNLTKDGDDNIIFKYVIFSSADRSYDNGVSKPSNQSTMVVGSFANVTAEGGTYMYTGIKTGIEQFSDNDYKKVLVVLTDGAANDKASVSSSALSSFKDPEGTDGTVFTVGFAYANDTLADIAGNGGTYVHAGDDVELSEAMQNIETSLTAMLEDPMGTSVGFDKTSIQEIQTSGGVVSSNSDTIFWHPAEDGSDSVRNSTIEYSYTVKLNQLADFSSGLHQVALNNPTYFRYGLKTGQNEPTEMKEAKFPIPTAEYSVSSVQTKWQANGTDIQPPLEVEHRVCDYASAGYIPAFTQDYQTITPVIPIEGTNDYYRYIGTTVTANGTQLPGVEAVDASKARDYLVIHQYERVNANELAVGGTKTLIGRDFEPGDSFTFTLTAVTPGAPMPASNTVTITPESGTSMAFSFDSITYDEAGTYTYTIQELDGSLDKVIYDTAPRTLVVTAQEVNREIVVSYTMDGVANGALTVINHLETGALKVEKTGVVSHLSEHQTKEFGFLIYLKDASNRPLNGTYAMQRSDGATQSLTFTNGYAPVMLRAGEWVVIDGLPDGAAYTVTEDAAGGFTVTSSGDTGVIAAHEQREASFANVYHSAGLYQFIGTKRLQDATLTLNQFSFSVLDESGQVVATGKNNTDGSIFLNTLYFTEKDIGTKTYTIVEDLGSAPGIIYDRTAYEVTLTIVDKGDGTLAVTDDLNGTPILFRNQFVTNQLAVSKTVEGDIGSRNKDFPFTISLPDMAGQNVSVSTDGGTTFQSVTLNAQGTMDFTLRHGQSIIFYPVSGAYTVTETDAGGYTTTCAVNQGTVAESRTASGTISTDGATVAFINTLQAVTPTGVRTSAGSAVAGLCMAAGLLAILLARRRCSGLE